METYTEPIRPQSPKEMAKIRAFLSEFYRSIICQRRLELDELLEEYPDSVGKYYDYLVLETQRVSREDFWQRYLYKCDEKKRRTISYQPSSANDDYLLGQRHDDSLKKESTKEEETATTCSLSSIDWEDD